MHLGGPLPEPMYHGGPKGKQHHHEEPAAPAGPAVDLVLEVNGEWHDKQVTAGVTDAELRRHRYLPVARRSRLRRQVVGLRLVGHSGRQ